MKKYVLFFTLCMTLVLSSCAKDSKQNVSLDYVAEQIKSVANIQDLKEEKIDSMSIAKIYGISTDMLESGISYSSTNDKIADEVIILKAKDSKSVLDLERSMQREIEAISKAWESNKDQYKIVKEHIVKTSGNFVILVVSEKVKDIEKIFDDLT